MKTSHKILTSVSIAIAPAAAVVAAAGFSSAAPLGPSILSACVAVIGLQLVAMTDRPRRRVPSLTESAAVPAYARRRPVAPATKIHRSVCVSP